MRKVFVEEVTQAQLDAEAKLAEETANREELENNGADIVAAVPGDLFTIYEEKQHD